jgi:hypothetical protein
MANYGKYSIPLLEEDLPTIKEFFKIALNTLFFHRWIGETNFEDSESIIPNINYIKLKNDNLQKEIEKNVNLLEKKINESKRVEVKINFYTEKKINWMFREELDKLWESWTFVFLLKNKSDNNNNDNNDNNNNEEEENSKENLIRKYLFIILQKLNDKIDFMPNLNNNNNKLEKETFPYEIIINNNLSDNYFIKLMKEISIQNALKDSIL